MASSLKILFASAEVVPYAKTGGLADVAGALPQVLAQLGHDVRIIMPRYGSIDTDRFQLRPLIQPFTIPHGSGELSISLEQCDAINGVSTYFIRNDELYHRDSLYGQADDDKRFIAYCRGMLEVLPKLDWVPDIIHCNDWHTGLVPVYLKTLYADNPAYADIATLYTIHNLAYQGNFDPQVVELAGLPWELFTWDNLAFWGKFNFMKSGLLYADKLSTVSEKYAQEIQTPEFGEGLDGVMAYRRDDLSGILNGIDYQIWNPQNDQLIAQTYSSTNLAGKLANKHALQRMMGLPLWEDAPLVGIVSRLSSQKGFDLLASTLPTLMARHKIQIVILGTGEEYYETMLAQLAERFPDKLSLALRFDDKLAHAIYAGSDGFCMPSRYEPCGLGQMISMAYGTLPVVHAIGGLADTVHEMKSVRGKGNGFIFDKYAPEALLGAMERAISCFNQKEDCWNKAIQNAFASNFSWETSAKKYLKVYKEAMKSARNAGNEVQRLSA